VAVLSLGLGIGAVVSVYTMVSGVLLHPVPFEDAERIVSVENIHLKGGSQSSVSYPLFLDWQENNEVMEHLTVFTGRSHDLSGPEGPEWIQTGMITSSFFPLLRVQPVLGRNFRPEEDQAGNANVVILSHSLWMNRFDGRENVIGEGIELSEESFTVVGVAPSDFLFIGTENAQLFMPAAAAGFAKNRGNHWLSSMGRLKDGVSMEQAQSAMTAITKGLADTYPDNYTDRGVGIRILGDAVTEDSAVALLILMGCVAFVLLISCVNVATLLLARVAARQQEVSVRVALGSTRWRLLRQLLTESALLALLGGAAGMLFAVWGKSYIFSMMPPENAQFFFDYFGFGFNAEVLTVTLVVTLTTAVVFGLVPALRASNPDLSQALKEGGSGSGVGARRHRLLHGLVVGEFALALVLLVGAGLMARSYQHLEDVDPGLDPSNVLVVSMNLPEKSYPEDNQKAATYRQLEERVGALGNVESVGATLLLPFSGSNSNNTIAIETRPDPGAGYYDLADYRVITPNYPRTMGISLVKGRQLTEQDNNRDAPVALINQAMADEFWPESDPIGMRFKQGIHTSEGPWISVVGVLGNVRHRGLEEDIRSAFYLPHPVRPHGRMVLTARTTGDAAALTNSVRQIIREINPNIALRLTSTMESVVEESKWGSRLIVSLFVVLSAVALCLAVGGIYGVISYSVSQRTHEIGIRMALGAQPSNVMRLVVGQGLKLGVLGVIVGLPLAFSLARLMGSLVFGVSTGDPTTFVSVSILLVVVALVASYIPARRATQIEPDIALRYD
jgi:putative ABC transport system permease protein